MANLNDMRRNDLNAHAASVGVEDPESYANKADLIAAIEATDAEDTVTGSALDAETEQAIKDALATGQHPPTGIRINFGDPEPFRKIDEKDGE